MIFQVKIINGVKKLVPITTDSGQGLPLGAITAFYGATAPTGYLLCDGSSFDSTTYPALAALLGDNHTPDLRECTLKGIGENPNATDHVKAGGLALGEFQDDRLQNHYHKTPCDNVRDGAAGTASFVGSNKVHTSVNSYVIDNPSTRFGATTEVKSVGVNYIIKAVIGPIESSEADQVVNVVKKMLSGTIDNTKFAPTINTDITATHNGIAYFAMTSVSAMHVKKDGAVYFPNVDGAGTTLSLTGTVFIEKGHTYRFWKYNPGSGAFTVNFIPFD